MQFLVLTIGVLLATLLGALLYGLADSDLNLTFLSLAGLNGALCIFRFFRAFQQEDRDIFNPISIFIIFFFFYHAMPIFALIGTSSEPVDVAGHLPAMWVTLTAICAFEGGLFLYRPRRLEAVPALPVNKMMQFFTPPFLILAAPFLGSMGIGHFGPAQVGFLITLYALLSIKDNGGFVLKIMCACFVLYAIYISRTEFSRAFILQIGLMCLVFYNYYARKLLIFEFFIIGVVSIFLLFTLAFFRAYEALFDGESFTFSRMFEYFRNFFILTDLSPEVAARFLRTADFPMAYESFRIVVENVPKQVDYLFGETYLKYILFVVPRDIYPEKPVDLHTLFVHTFLNPHSFHYSNSPLLLGEFYWNGGYLGVIFGMIVLAVVVKWTCGYRRKITENNLYFSYYIVFLLTLPLIMRGSTATISIHVATTQIIPIFLIFMLLNFLSYRRQRIRSLL